MSLPLLKVTKGHNLVVIGPLPRYVTYKCCGDSGHITNYDDENYIDNVAAGVKERGIQLKNLLRTRRIGCEIVVPLAAMGLDGEVPLEDRVRLWGRIRCTLPGGPTTTWPPKFWKRRPRAQHQNRRTTVPPGGSRGRP